MQKKIKINNTVNLESYFLKTIDFYRKIIIEKEEEIHKLKVENDIHKRKINWLRNSKKSN